MESSLMIRMQCGALLLACAFTTGVPAQDYKPTPVDICFSLGSLRVGPEAGSSASPLPYELLPRLSQGVEACEQAVKERPEGRLYSKLGRMKLLAGDSKGGLEATRRAVDAGSPVARVVLGVLLVDGTAVARDYAAAREELLAAAKAGHPYAHFNLGVMRANGWGFAADAIEAAAAFRRAANGGDALAMQVLGQRYEREQAQAWFRKAAETMIPDAMQMAMRIGSLGRVEIDTGALVAWYGERARGGEPWAQTYFGLLHLSGQWVPQDAVAAADWYRKAALANYTPAEWRLSNLYSQGMGVPQDRVEARRWSDRSQVRRCEAAELADANANPCDRFAADRFDPQKTTAGVDSFCMRQRAEKAVAACTVSVKQSPTNARYRAQLARAVAHTGDFERARREARTAAAAGSTAAMVLLGAMSQRGLGGAANGSEALAWYRKAAEKGDPRGVAFVSASAMNGVGVEKGSPEAKRLLDEMASRPMVAAARPSPSGEPVDARGQHNLAVQMEGAKKYDEAIRLYSLAAGQGFQVSAMNLAQMYEKGIGVPRNPGEAMQRYRKLADAGNGEARYRLAHLSEEAGNFSETQRLLRKSIEEDDYRAMLDLGEMLEQGRGGPKDVPQAVRLYERGAKSSSGWAQARLGAIYLQGSDIPKDYAKAREWLRRAADMSHGGARNNLALMHDRGLGGPVDHAAARELWLAALSVGNVQARGNLEAFFADGRGAPSGAKAIEWYRPGAERGVASAQFRLGQLYRQGGEIKRDDQEALRWFAKAAGQGHPGARKEAADLLFSMGKHQEAALLGHEGAALALAARASAQGGPAAGAEVVLLLKSLQGRAPTIPEWPRGIASDPGEDTQRKMSVRAANIAVPQAATSDASIASVFEVVRWFPETDEKAKPR